MGVLQGRHDPARLVERDVITLARQTDRAAIKCHPVRVQIHFRAEFGHDLAVDLDSALSDPCFADPARADPGGGERFLKSF